MRVLHLNGGNLYGGIETLLVALARFRHLSADLDPYFAVSFEGRFTSELERAGAPVRCLGPVRTSRPWTVWRARRHLQQLLRRDNIDVVICHGAWSLAIFGKVANAMGIPLVFWVHDPPRRRLHWIERWAQNVRPQLVIANSRYTAAGVHRLYRTIPVRVIYCALSPPPAGAVIDAAAVRRQWRTPEDATVILQVSRLDPHKGHFLHLEALALLRDVPGWVCWFVAGPQRREDYIFLKELEATAQRLSIADRVRFLGWQSDMEYVFGSADIFCQPNSNPEPFGLTFVEALWRRLPVVTTALGGAVEIVNSTCGIVVPPGDAYALAGALRRLIADPALRRDLGAVGPERAEALCSPERHLEALAHELAVVNLNTPAAASA